MISSPTIGYSIGLVCQFVTNRNIHIWIYKTFFCTLQFVIFNLVVQSRFQILHVIFKQFAYVLNALCHVTKSITLPDCFIIALSMINQSIESTEVGTFEIFWSNSHVHLWSQYSGCSFNDARMLAQILENT